MQQAFITARAMPVNAGCFWGAIWILYDEPQITRQRSNEWNARQLHKTIHSIRVIRF
jgi:hypothetical protein